MFDTIPTQILMFFGTQAYINEKKSHPKFYQSNFINLCHHSKDFGLNAEWIFFAKNSHSAFK